MLFSLYRTFKPTSLSVMQHKVVFVLGAPGAGKGTQCKKIVKDFGFVHLSAGDLLREERAKPGSEYGELIENYIRDGKIVPVEITCSLLENAMNKSGKHYFLIDGFPRNQNNLDGWNKQITDQAKVLFVLFIKTPSEICIERCLNRGVAGSGRTDDNMESLTKRLHTYFTETQPIVDHYDQLNLLKSVDGTKNPDEVYTDVKQLFTRIERGEGDGNA